MRLTCPNCGAIYQVEEEVFPAGGSHVQCSACHTRWFARADEPEPERLSEDEIIARLETRAQRPRLAAVTEAPPSRAPAEPPAVAKVEPPANPPQAPAVARPLRPKPAAQRFEPAPPRPAPQPTKRSSRFGLGFVVTLALTAGALAAYLRAEDLARAEPRLAPAIEAYAARVDAVRDWIELRLGPLRDDATSV